MRFKAACLLLICFLGYNAHAQVQLAPGHQSLNGTWAFRTDPNDAGEENKWYDEKASTAGWDSMPVPGNWDLRNEYAHYAGKAWYRTTFNAPATDKGKLIRLLFESVYHDSKVWLNGHLLGSNNTGFLPFEFEINKWIHHDKPNTLAVCADNSFRRGAIWNWGGIRRPVTLVASNTVRILRQNITPVIDLAKKTALVTVQVQVKNDEANAVKIQGQVSLTNENGFQITLPFTTDVAPGDTGHAFVKTTITGKQFHLWNCDDPYLYSSKAQIKNRQDVVDENSDRFGLRKVEVDNKNYTFKLNGVSMRIMGFNLVPDDRTTGNTLPAWRFKEDIDLMKSMGANLARLTHLPLPEEMIDYLDEKGIMNFAEIPLWGYDQLVDKDHPNPKEWLKRLVGKQYNHPSIIGWSVGNEIGYVPGVMEYVESAVKYVKALDTTRLGVVVSHTASQGKSDPMNYSDIGLINGYGVGIGSHADRIHGLHPNQLLFFTEYGYGQLEENLNSDVDAKGMIDSLRNKPYLMGGSLWTFNDYRSSFPGTKEFSENRPWGVVDVFRQKKKAWYSFKKEYTPVRDIDISDFKPGSNASATIIITPRQKLDLPAYPLQDYNLVWKVCDASGMLQKGGFIRLPVINPGDAALRFPINWQMPDDAFSLQLCLQSSQNYTVGDTVIYLKKPSAPKIISATGSRTAMNDSRVNSGNIRVVFEKNPTATSYKLRYGKDGLTNETPLTSNNFLQVTNLAFGDTYQVALIGVNNLGESEAGNAVTIKIEKEYPAPFAIYTEAADKGFFVGYSTTAEDYLFQLQYTTTKGDYSGSPIVQANTKGVLFVPGLQNGQTYYYRIRQRKSNNYVTAWSGEMMATTDGGMPPAAPQLSGVIRQGAEAIACFEPVKKATGYMLEYKPASGSAWQKQVVNAAQLNHYHVKGLQPKTAYEFRIAATGANGQSQFSQTIKQ